MKIKSESSATINTQSWIERANPIQGLISRIKNWDLVAGFALVILIAAVSVSLTVQGWRSRTTAHDLVPHIINARNLVNEGRIPIHGDTGSYGSYKPPGTAWLMVPSTLIFSDPRLSEYVGTSLLHVATLTGIFLLAYHFFGFWSACLAILIYGLSNIGIMLAGSLWPNGRPDFYIWIIYFASQWVIRRNAKYLAIAGAIWGVGMNVDMAILPAVFILPALWLVYRPPLQLKPLIVAIGLVLIVWSPYLRFEIGRNFADIRSQVLFQNIFPANYREAWCDANVQLREFANTSQPIPMNSTQPPPYQGPNLTSAARVLTAEIMGKLENNFFQNTALFPVMRILFLGIVLSSLILFNTAGYTSGIDEPSQPRRFWNDRITQFAVGMILIGMLTNEFVITRVLGLEAGLQLSTIKSLRTIEKLLILGGACILAGKWMTAVVDQLLLRRGIQVQAKERADQMKVLVLSLAIPWFILLLVAEPGKPERFWWLWPMQAMFLAAFITWFLSRLQIPRLFIWMSFICITIVVGWNPYLLSRMHDWRQNGWAGAGAPEVQAIDYVAKELRAEGIQQAAIGYHFFIYEFMAAYHITNPEYKAGMDFDLLFKYPYGITNTDQCAEGLSPLDEYRIVQTKPQDGLGTPRLYFDVPLDANFKLLREFGPYQVFKRQ